MSGRSKVPLAPGHTMMDWNRLASNLAHRKGGRATKITMAELRQHATEDDAWMAVRGLVYNVTPYIRFHPGGGPELMRAAGADGTYLFDEAHKWVGVEGIMQHCLVGTLVEDKPPSSSTLTPFTRPPVSFCSCTLEGVSQHTHNTYILDVGLAEPITVPLGQHIRLRSTGVDGRGVVIREFTPLNPLGAEPSRSLQLLVKLYPEGAMSQVLRVLIARFLNKDQESKTPQIDLKEQDSTVVSDSPPSLSLSISPPSTTMTIQTVPSRSAGAPAPLLALGCSGAIGSFSYELARPHSKLGVIAAGTGLSPFYRIVPHFLASHKPDCLSVLSVNRSKDDILGATLLEGWQKGGSSVSYLVSDSDSNLSGRITKDMLSALMPGPGPVLVLVCGPPGFGSLVAKYLVQLGYTEAMFHVFA